jgi:hypothetical protein
VKLSWLAVRKRLSLAAFATGTVALMLALPGQAWGEHPRFCELRSAEAALASSEGPRNEMAGYVVLLVNRSRAAGGERIYARLANFSGMVRADYGAVFAIDRKTPNGWERDPASPDGPWPKKGRQRVGPSRAGHCYVFDIPAEQAEGTYRFSTDVGLHSERKDETVMRYAEFKVQQTPVPRFCEVSTAGAVLAASSRWRDKQPPGGVVLLTNRARVAPGELIYARLANFSQLRNGYGGGASIQRKTASGWVHDPAAPEGFYPAVLRRLDPGAAGYCYPFEVPVDHPSGQYRFVTDVHFHARGESRWRVATFEVSG